MIINHDGDNAAGTATPSWTAMVNDNASTMQHYHQQQDHLESHPQQKLRHQQQQQQQKQLQTTMVGQVYRFCFALNNAGVSLMEQGQYPQALVTFRVTASAIRSLVHLSAQQEQEQEQEQQHEEQAPVPPTEQRQVATQNMARLQKLLTSLDSHLTQASRAVAQHKHHHRDGACLGFPNVYAVEEDDLTNLRDAVQYGMMPTGTTIYPIRLRHSYLPSSITNINHHPLSSSLGCTEDSSSHHGNNREYEDYGFSIAIIFYNYGLAQREKSGCSRECHNDWDKQMLAVGQLFTLALRFLSRGNNIADYDAAATDAADQHHDQQGRSLQCLFLSSLVLSNMTTVYRLLCQYDRVRALELTLDRLQVEQNEHWESWLGMESAIGISCSTAAVTALAA